MPDYRLRCPACVHGQPEADILNHRAVVASVRYSPVLLSFIALFASCDPGPTVVVGDIYIIEEMGLAMSLGSIDVHVLPDRLELDSALLKICPNRDLTVRPDSAAVAVAWEARRELLLLNSRQVTRADAEASFVIDSVAPGRYRLWADTTVNGDRFTWLRPVFIRRGDDTVRANLDNANLDEDPFRCFRKIW